MSNPGFMGQQAAQQAAASASRAAQQQASTNYDMALQGSSRAARGYGRPAGRVGVFGVIGRLIGLVVSLVFIAVAVAVFLMVLSAAQPDWFDHVKTWFDGNS